jgi:hypothetical protein
VRYTHTLREITMQCSTARSTRACQADRDCTSTPRFQARLEAANGDWPVRLNVRACAHHFGDAAQALTDWARARHITDGQVTVLVIDPPPCHALPGPPNQRRIQAPGIAFTTIPLAS